MDKSLEAAKIYDLIAEKYSEMFDEELEDKSYLDRFLSFLPKKGKILDLGCGTGGVTDYYFKKGFKVLGIDLSQGMIQVAKKKYPKINFINEDMRKLRLNEKFDGISFSYSFFYLETKDTKEVIENAKNMLNENGVMMFILQEGEGEIYFDELNIPEMKTYANLYTKKIMERMLNSLGLKIVYTEKRAPRKGEMPYNKLCIIAKKDKFL